MAEFAHKEIEDKFYQELLSTKISDKEKITLIQDFMLVYGDETIESNYAFVLLKIMACDTESLKDKTIEHRPVFKLDDAKAVVHKFIKI